MKAAIEGVPGVKDLMVEQQIEIPQLQIKLDRDQLARYGLTVELRERVHRDGHERPHRFGDRARASGSSTWSCGWTTSSAQDPAKLRRLSLNLPAGGTRSARRASPTSSAAAARTRSTAKTSAGASSCSATRPAAT